MAIQVDRNRGDRIHDLIELLQPAGLALDFTAASLARIDGFIAEHLERGAAADSPWADQRDHLLPLLGDYVGETVRRNRGGSWEDGRVVLDDGDELQPMEAIKGRLADAESLRNLLPPVKEPRRTRRQPQPVTRGYRKRPGPSEELSPPAEVPRGVETPPFPANPGSRSDTDGHVPSEKRLRTAALGWKLPLIGYMFSLLAGWLATYLDGAGYQGVGPAIPVFGLIALALLFHLRAVIAIGQAAWWLCTSERHLRMGLRLLGGLFAVVPLVLGILYILFAVGLAALLSARAAAGA